MAQFQGTTTDFYSISREIVAHIFKPEGMQGSMTGIMGYKNFASNYCEGDMLRAHQLVSAVCKFNKLPFESLGWSQFHGTVSDFENLGFAISNQFKELHGIEGYKKFCQEHTEGDMQRGFVLVSAICKLSGLSFKDLNWSLFAGTVSEFEELGSDVKITLQKVIEPGYFSPFLREHAEALQNKINEVALKMTTDPQLRAEVDKWQVFFKLSERFKERLKDFNWDNLRQESISSALLGMDGQRNFAIECTDGQMQKAFTIVSAFCALENINFERLGWNSFAGTVKQFDLIQEGISKLQEDSKLDIWGFILHKYGLIKKFVEGTNLHVRANSINRISLDFYLEDKEIFIEYHPLSIGEIYDGVTLEQAGRRKIDSIQGGKYDHCRVIHIHDFDGLYEALVKDLGINISYSDFELSLAEARSYGYKCDRIEG